MVVVLATLAVSTAMVGAAFGQGATISYVTGFTKFKVVAKTSSSKVSGKLGSTEAACISGRKVKALRKRKGKTKQLGTDKTNSKGKFAIKISSAKNGKYFAKISKKDLSPASTGQARVCIAEKSGTVKVS
jgi:hypothetical protein